MRIVHARHLIAAVAAVLLLGVASSSARAQTAAEAMPVTTKTAAATAKVTPPFASAAQDEPPFRKLGCHTEYEGHAVPPKAKCTVGKVNSHKRALLIGDSIAPVLAPAMQSHAIKHGWALTVWSKARCAFTSGITTFSIASKHPYTECVKFRENVLKRAIADKTDLVILAMASNSATKILQDGRSVTGKNAQKVAIDGVARTVKRLRKAGVHVVLVQSPTLAPFSPSACMIKKKNTSACSFKARSGEQTVMGQAAKKTKAQYITTNARACPKQKCRPTVKNIVVYRDTTHYTKTFAATLTPAFKRLPW